MKKKDTGKSIDSDRRGRGRPPKGADRAMTLRLAAATVDRMDASLADREGRSDFIRAAIEREIARRSRPSPQ